MPLTIKVQGQDVMVVEEFVYLGSLTHSSSGSTCDISRRSAITRAAMQSLENQIWRSRLTSSTKLKLYNTCILPIFLYGSDCLAISKTDACKIDVLDQWCLRMLLGIKWYQFVQNDDVWTLTKQPKLTAIIQSCWLTLFRHIMRMDDNADAKRILLASPPADWRRQLGHPRITWLSTVQQDLKQHHLTLPEAADLAQNRLCGGCRRRMALRSRELHASLVQEHSRIDPHFQDRSLTKRFIPTRALVFCYQKTLIPAATVM